MKKTLKNLAMAALMSGAMAFSNPIYSQHPETQKQETPKEQKLFPDLNFYFETGEYLLNRDAPEFKKYIKAWLCACPKEDNKGFIFFNYGDADDDGFYDYVLIDKMDDQIRSKEKFYFNMNTKKIDYALDIYEFCPKIITDCDRIISKSYNEIDQKESYKIGEDFNERIKKFLSVQKEFSRFNSESLEKLVREEFDYKLKLVDGKLAGNSGTPIEKFLSEEEIKKVENYYKEKPERERIKREQEERAKAFKIEQEKIAKIEYDKMEKIRREEKEARKIIARLKIGGGVAITNPGGHAGLFLGITPQLTNKKGKGFVAGLDMFMMNSKMVFELYGGSKGKETELDYKSDLISITSYTNSILVKTTNRFGFKIGHVSPAFEIFANAGFLRQKMLITTIARTEEYTEVYGVKQGASSFKTKIEDWEREKFFGPFYSSLEMDVFPFLKKDSQENNLSFSIDGLLHLKGRKVYSSHSPRKIYSPVQFIINAGLKYTFRKQNGKTLKNKNI